MTELYDQAKEKKQRPPVSRTAIIVCFLFLVVWNIQLHRDVNSLQHRIQEVENESRN